MEEVSESLMPSVADNYGIKRHLLDRFGYGPNTHIMFPIFSDIEVGSEGLITSAGMIEYNNYVTEIIIDEFELIEYYVYCRNTSWTYISYFLQDRYDIKEDPTSIKSRYLEILDLFDGNERAVTVHEYWKRRLAKEDAAKRATQASEHSTS